MLPQPHEQGSRSVGNSGASHKGPQYGEGPQEAWREKFDFIQIFSIFMSVASHCKYSFDGGWMSHETKSEPLEAFPALWAICVAHKSFVSTKGISRQLAGKHWIQATKREE